MPFRLARWRLSRRGVRQLFAALTGRDVAGIARRILSSIAVAWIGQNDIGDPCNKTETANRVGNTTTTMRLDGPSGSTP
jgi:hypothetical protein